MISKEHNKHSSLVKPSFGYFGRNEWAILGTDCNRIKHLSDLIIAALSPSYKIAYVDAHHNHLDTAPSLPARLASGADIEYTEHISYEHININRTFNSFQKRQLFNETDLVLVNGNHHQAKAQVVVIDEVKRSSLEKRVAQLSNVQLILLINRTDEIFDFIKELPGFSSIPVIEINETDQVIDFFSEKLSNATSVLNGLVLRGGKSTRLGKDKGKIKWHDKEQQYHLYELLKQYCGEVYISCREDQQQEIKKSYQTIPDTYLNLGPYGGILSAFQSNPNCGWLVVACDLPLVDKKTISYLVRNRNCSVIATAYENPEDGNPEPLITIWEPKSYMVLLSFLAQGFSCPRKVLKNTDIHLLKAPWPKALTNVNTSEEAKKVKSLLQHKEMI